MKLKLIALSILLTTSQLALAKMHSPMPASCPSIQSVVKIGVNDADDSGIFGGNHNNWYGFNLKNNFGTDNDWTLVALPSEKLEADSKKEALMKLNHLLAGLSNVDGPEEDSDGAWGCMYMDSSENSQIEPSIVALAVTPAFGPDMSVNGLIKNRFNLLVKDKISHANK